MAVAVGDRCFALICSAFAVLLGLSLGVVFGYAEPAVVAVAQDRFDASAVNQTATAIQGALEARPDGAGVAPAVFVLLLLANNAIVAGLIAFNYRFLLPVQSVIVTFGALFMNGLIAGAMLIREVQAAGVGPVLPMVAWGALEFAAFVTAGAVGYLGLTGRRPDGRGTFAAGILPTLAAAGLLEGAYLTLF